MSKTKYKFLNLRSKKIVSKHGNLEWKIGEWQHVDRLDICNSGLHCSDKIYQAFSYVQGEVLAIVEVKGKSIKEDDKSAWTDMRIIKAYKWTKKDSVSLAIFSAELCLKEFEKQYPDDKRPREAIEAARAVLANDTKAARSAAWSAARSAESAARSAAWSAESAAWSAARSAARSAAESAESRTLKKIEKWLVNHIEEMEQL